MSSSLLTYFPYSKLRPHQDKLILLSNKAIKKGLNAIIEAPTGIGKTLGVLAGILNELLTQNLKLMYVCRTHTQMTRVIEELRAIIAKKRRSNQRNLSLEKEESTLTLFLLCGEQHRQLDELFDPCRIGV